MGRRYWKNLKTSRENIIIKINSIRLSRSKKIFMLRLREKIKVERQIFTLLQWIKAKISLLLTTEFSRLTRKSLLTVKVQQKGIFTLLMSKEMQEIELHLQTQLNFINLALIKLLCPSSLHCNMLFHH